MMYIKIHEAYRKIVAVADTNLIGEKFEEGNMQIEVKPSFYKGEEKSKKEAIKMLKNLEKEDATFNIVGEKSIEAALEAGVIKKEGIIKIDEIPVALGLM